MSAGPGPSRRLGPRILTTYLVAFAFLALVPVVLATILVSARFHPTLSEEFLFLYFGISSAVAVATWSTFVQAASVVDKRVIFYAVLLTNVGSILALAAAVVGPSGPGFIIDLSASFLVVGLCLMVFHSINHLSLIEQQLNNDERPDG